MHGWSVGGWRCARACALSATTLALSCTAHLLGGGHRPSLLAVVGLAVPLLVASLLLLGRRRGPLTVAAALVIGQALVHETLMLTGMPSAAVPASAAHSMATHSMQVTGDGLPAVMASPTPMASGFPLAMLMWHALATLAIAAGLAFGERAVHHLVRWVVSPRSPGVRLPAPVVRASVQAFAHPVALRSPWLRSVSRRGPPLSVANLI